jgi:penicillin-binding protein 1A
VDFEYEGGEMPTVERTGEQVMDGIIAYQLVSMMEGVTSRGTAARLSVLGFPVAGKTGTTNDGRDAWFIGFTPNLVAGCYIGFDQPKSLGKGGTGGGLCAPVFQDFMERAMKDRPKPAFQPPRDARAVKISLSTGRRLPDDAEGANVAIEYFSEAGVPAVNAPVRSIVGGFPGDDAFSLNDFNRRVEPVEATPEPEPQQPAATSPRRETTGQPARREPPPPPRATIGAGTGGLY